MGDFCRHLLFPPPAPTRRHIYFPGRPLCGVLAFKSRIPRGRHLLEITGKSTRPPVLAIRPNLLRQEVQMSPNCFRSSASLCFPPKRWSRKLKLPRVNQRFSPSQGTPARLGSGPAFSAGFERRQFRDRQGEGFRLLLRQKRTHARIERWEANCGGN